jgi:ribonuclease HI
MTYAFPESLTLLRKYLKSNGFDGDSVKTSRQAAFVAQQLLGTRVKFPPQGQDMTLVLLEIQKAVPAKDAGARNRPAPANERGSREGVSSRAKRKHRRLPLQVDCDFSRGQHIFCDGACEPNPGAGGWGVVAYNDGKELNAIHGGNPATTNNQMELTGLLEAIEWAKAKLFGEVTIWCDSQYCVNGVNEWLAGWKRNGWNRKKPNSPNRAEGEIKNLDLWRAIDEALSDIPDQNIRLCWVKGHAGVAGNERADELAEIGRQEAIEMHADLLTSPDDLDERYRQIMGAA